MFGSGKSRCAAIALIAVWAFAVGSASVSATPARTAKADHASKAAPGGTYRVDWESSFDFSSGFDPTGEYSVQAFGLYSNLLVRTLVGYNHVAGPAGNRRRARSRDEPRDDQPRRPHLHVPAQARASASARR